VDDHVGVSLMTVLNVDWVGRWGLERWESFGMGWSRSTRGDIEENGGDGSPLNVGLVEGDEWSTKQRTSLSWFREDRDT